MDSTWSDRAKCVYLRTYSRPEDGGETWDQTCSRVVQHSYNLYCDAIGAERSSWLAIEDPLYYEDKLEYKKLYDLIHTRKVLPAGRTLWLGGTELAYRRASCQFNCAYTEARTIYDLVDIFWLLLQGCGVGFTPKPGTLTGFRRKIDVQTVGVNVNSPDFRGPEENIETVEGLVWTIKVGDSAEAWAKCLGKLLAHGTAPNCNTLVLDFSNVRGAGERLSGYGWICNGSKPFADALVNITNILNAKQGHLLDEMDILDIVNYLGTVLSSRRSAQIALLPYDSPNWKQFALAKKEFWLHGNEHRQQSNNSIVFTNRPSKRELKSIFDIMEEGGGSEPGFINGSAALKRAPWFEGVNPCGEILLTNKGFCNLVEIDLSKFNNDFAGLLQAARIITRHNYRQTCVNLNDGILQPAWHQNNYALRLCGVSLTGIVQSNLTDYQLKELRNEVVKAAYEMADELGLPRPKNITTGKPSGTLSKLMDTTEGIHRPLGRYIFNWIGYPSGHPIVERLRRAKYRIINHPSDPNSVLVCFPIEYDGVEFGKSGSGKAINTESAVSQLQRYARYQRLWCDQNMSNTISYSPEEVPEIIDWLYDNWNDYVGVSWLYRNDPTKTAEDLGYLYLPQEVRTKEDYDEYKQSLQPLDLNNLWPHEGTDNLEAECEGGACPVR